MNLDKITGIAMAIVIVGGITTVVIHPASVAVIRAIGTAFQTSLRTAIIGV